LAEPVAQAQVSVPPPPVNNVDETGWREGNQRTGLWINTTPVVTIFLLLATRGAEGAKHVLGQVLKKIVGSDRQLGLQLAGPAEAASVLGASEA